MQPRSVVLPRRAGGIRSPWEILAAGTISADDITTPAGRARESLGGSATYFAMAAHWFAPVRVASAVGQDFADQVIAVLGGPSINLEGLEIYPEPTYRWTATHALDGGETVTQRSDLGAMRAFTARLSRPARRAPITFLGSMDPRHQLAVRDQLQAPHVVAADTMNTYIAEQRDAVLSMLARADIIFVNESEASHLAKNGDPEAAAARLYRRLVPRALVLKRGPRGAVLFHGDVRLARPAVAVSRVVDPTGAGDAFAGGFLGELARRRAQDHASLEAAFLSALVMASFAIEAFGVEGLRAADPERIARRAAAHAHAQNAREGARS